MHIMYVYIRAFRSHLIIVPTKVQLNKRLKLFHGHERLIKNRSHVGHTPQDHITELRGRTEHLPLRCPT